MYSRCGKPSANARSPSLLVAKPGLRKRAPYAPAPCARACVVRTGPSPDTGMRPVVRAGGAVGAAAWADIEADAEADAEVAAEVDGEAGTGVETEADGGAEAETGADVEPGAGAAAGTLATGATGSTGIAEDVGLVGPVGLLAAALAGAGFFLAIARDYQRKRRSMLARKPHCDEIWPRSPAAARVRVSRSSCCPSPDLAAMAWSARAVCPARPAWARSPAIPMPG